MSVTTVPLRPIKKGSMLKFWIGGAALAAVGTGLAMAGTETVVVQSMPAEQFLAHNAREKGVITTASGLQYKILTEGTGPRPAAEDVVQVHYEGRLRDGTVFDSSYQRGEPVAFPLSQVIPGWTEGVQLMPVGSKFHFWIPPELGYGAEGAGGVIPPNAVLEFDIELLAIAPRGMMPGHPAP